MMKSKKLFFLTSLMSMLFLYSCFQEEEVALPALDEADEMEARALGPTAAYPDLVFDSFGSTLPVTQGPCPGGPLPNTTCAGGAQSWNFNAVIRNRSTVALPAGTFDICWRKFGGPSVLQTITHPGIPGQGLYPVTSPQFNLPCPGGPPPFALITEVYYGEVDCSNTVTEFNENNNFSRRYYVCTSQ